MKLDGQKKKYALILALQTLGVAVILAIDLLTKHFIFGAHSDRASTTVVIDGVLVVTAVKNTGASFGIFEGSVLALGIVSLIASIAIAAVMVISVKLKNGLLATSLTLILGGALGNMVDRLFLGYVRDFIHLPFLPFFGIFNIADNALTLGVVLILIYLIFFYSRDMQKLADLKAATGTAGSENAQGVENAETVSETAENAAVTEEKEAVTPENSTAVSENNVVSESSETAEKEGSKTAEVSEAEENGNDPS